MLGARLLLLWLEQGGKASGYKRGILMTRRILSVTFLVSNSIA
jgi:hypothetical protein